MSGSDEIVQRLLNEGLDDVVPLDRLIGSVRELYGSDPDVVRGAAIDLITRLVDGGLMIPGDLGHEGFEAWPGSAEEVVKRVVEQSERLGWDPIGAGCWWSNTEKGDELAGGWLPS